MLKIKRDDEVVIIAGRDKGKHGTVARVLENDRLLVRGVNMVKRHIKANPMRGEQGGIVEKEASIHVSNVAILNSVTNKADRVGLKILDDGSKVRIYKSNQEQIDA